MELNWPGKDDKRIVAEMLKDRSSPHWEKCCVFIRQLLAKRSVPVDTVEDVMQCCMFSVWRNLGKFRYECSLESWLMRVVERKTIDEFRNGKKKKRCTSIDAIEDTGDAGYIDIAETQTVEEQYEVREMLREIDASIKEFVARCVHSMRNEQILRLVMFGGYSCEEVARLFKVKLPVVYHVLRTARIYLRKHLCESRGKQHISEHEKGC